MTRDEKLELLQLHEERERRSKSRKLFTYYPDTGPLRRDRYVKHLDFFAAGAKYRERLMLAANRVGKTEGVGGYELALHLTGLYPNWWKGRRFKHPVEAWAAGDTSKTVRDIIQFKLLGPTQARGTGLIPADRIERITPRMGLADAADTIYVKHESGGMSAVVLKSYDQRRESFQGTEKDVIWLDEEPPLDIYTECLVRTMDTSGLGLRNGMLMLTFTPLMGMSETVMQFLPGGEIKARAEGSKYVVMATWDDAPHLTKEAKDELWKSIPPFQRDARSKGIPQLGAGAIYPVPESDIVVPDFQVPDHWPRIYGMDVGWNRTSAGFLAHDRESDVVYRYSEHYRGEAEPAVHAQAVKSRGLWIPGRMDPAARSRSQIDGRMLMQQYLDLGLKLEDAVNGVESGIYAVWQRMSSGRFKVFESCNAWRQEFRLYRRDVKGRIVKEMDHAMDDMRYGVAGLDGAKVKPANESKQKTTYPPGRGGSGSWMS